MNSEIKEVGKKYLSGETKYHYCPFCVSRLAKEGRNYKDTLKPLVMITYSVYVKTNDGLGKLFYEDKYKCLNCGTDRINTETYRLFYTRRYDGTKWNERPIEPGSVWSQAKQKLVPAKWNDAKLEWEEIPETELNAI